jgi:predicted amidophosphoribosyltransferase
MLDLIAPPVCVACGSSSDGDLCEACAVELVTLPSPTQSLVVWNEPARALALHVKRRGSRSAARAIGGLLADLARRERIEPDVVTFVPGTRARGFDHAELLARATASALDRPVRRLLRRVGSGPRQADVDLLRRHQNVAGRFAARRANGAVLLIDDVMTTGATTSVCAQALMRAGASRVDVLTWARTLRRSV